MGFEKRKFFTVSFVTASMYSGPVVLKSSLRSPKSRTQRMIISSFHRTRMDANGASHQRRLMEKDLKS